MSSPEGSSSPGMEVSPTSGSGSPGCPLLLVPWGCFQESILLKVAFRLEVELDGARTRVRVSGIKLSTGRLIWGLRVLLAIGHPHAGWAIVIMRGMGRSIWTTSPIPSTLSEAPIWTIPCSSSHGRVARLRWRKTMRESWRWNTGIKPSTCIPTRAPIISCSRRKPQHPLWGHGRRRKWCMFWFWTFSGRQRRWRWWRGWPWKVRWGEFDIWWYAISAINMAATLTVVFATFLVFRSSFFEYCGIRFDCRDAISGSSGSSSLRLAVTVTLLTLLLLLLFLPLLAFLAGLFLLWLRGTGWRRRRRHHRGRWQGWGARWGRRWDCQSRWRRRERGQRRQLDWQIFGRFVYWRFRR